MAQSAKQKKAFTKASSPEARAKAVETVRKLFRAREQFAHRFGVPGTEVTRAKILGFMKARNIPLSDVPEILLPIMGKGQRERLLASGGGSALPLDAFGERPMKAKGERKVYTKKVTGHPNEALILRAMDMMEKTTKDKVADRMLSLIDKLVGS